MRTARPDASRFSAFRALLAATLIPCAFAAGAEPAAAAATAIEESPLTRLRAIGRGWYVAPSGDIALPAANGAGQDVRLSSLDLDKSRLAPLGEVSIEHDKLLFSLSGAWLDAKRDHVATSNFQLGNTNVAAGNAVSSHLRIGTFDIKAGCLLLPWNFDTEKYEDTGDTRFRLHALAGVRISDVSFSITRPGVSTSEDSRTFVDLMAGVRAQVLFSKFFDMEVALNAGGLSRTFTWDIAVMGTWRPWTNVGLHVGYRHMSLVGSAGSGTDRFRYSGAMAGLFFGGEIRF